MKKFLRYLPYILYTLGFVSFILPVVYDSFDCRDRIAEYCCKVK